MPELSGLDMMRRLRLRSSAKVVILSHLGHEGSRERAEAYRLGALDVIDKPTGAVSRDLRYLRGSVIQQTLRRVLGLPAPDVPEEPLAPEGASTMASVLSVDVQGFASLCERVDPPQVVALMNEHLARVETVVRNHNGSVDAHVGRATLAVFGLPKRSTDHAARAVAAGRELIEAVDADRAERVDAGAPSLEVGIAIVTGLVVAGTLGPPGARCYRTAGGAIDLAARIGHANERYGAQLIVCRRTLAASEAAVASRRLDVVELDPNTEPIELSQLLSARSHDDAEALETYARGWEHYEAGRFDKAIYAFDRVLHKNPSDRAAALLRSRCRALLRAPPVAWRGVWPFDGVGA
jgi:adenylate cyclase